MLSKFDKVYRRIIAECNAGSCKKHIILEELSDHEKADRKLKLDLLTTVAISLVENRKFDEKICSYIGQIPVINSFKELIHMRKKSKGLDLLYKIVYDIGKDTIVDEFEDIDEDDNEKYVLNIDIEADRCLKLIASDLKRHGLFIGEKMGVEGGEAYNAAENIIGAFDEAEQYLDPAIIDKIKEERRVNEVNILA